MKKIVIILIFICTLTLTGCEKNRLVCTLEEESIKDILSKTEYTFSFNEENVKEVLMTTKMTLKGDYNDVVFIDSYVEMANAAANSYNQIEGVTATVTNNKNVITLKVEMLAILMNDEDKENYALNLTKEELKKDLEEAGYTCK